MFCLIRNKQGERRSLAFAPVAQILNSAATARAWALGASPHMLLLVQSGEVDAQRLGHLIILNDDQVLAREVLNRHILGLGLAL